MRTPRLVKIEETWINPAAIDCIVAQDNRLTHSIIRLRGGTSVILPGSPDAFAKQLGRIYSLPAEPDRQQ